MPKEVMINALSARGGGGQTYLINIIKYFKRKDLKLTILLTKGTNLEFENSEIEIYEAPSITRNPIIRQMWEISYLPLILFERKIDIFFCPGGVVPFVVYFKGKIVTMFRNMLPFDERQKRKYQFGFLRFRNWILSKIMLFSMQRADLVIFISKFAESVIQEKIQNPLKNSVLIPHGVDFTDKPSKGLSFDFLARNEEYILYPSSIDLYKSQLEVIKAYSVLINEGNFLPKLILAGSINANKSYTKKVNNLISKNNLEDRIILSGNVPYDLMPSLYKNAQFVIYASQTENCPNILLEALSCNCLILCSNLDPMPEFAQNSVLYFDPNNIQELMNQLKKILRKEVDEEGLKKNIPDIIKNFSWEDCANTTWTSISNLT